MRSSYYTRRAWTAPADDWSRETAARMHADGYSPGAIIEKLEAYGCGIYAAQGIVGGLIVDDANPAKIVRVG